MCYKNYLIEIGKKSIAKQIFCNQYYIVQILCTYAVVYNLHYDRDFFFHAISMNMNGMVMTDVAIITGSIISMSTGMPEAIR